ncbi:hypothetical protein PHYSODRAFT_322985 [Phytophthora sojae]|uniref:Uncharacterized protein n=1 Tax=Phytophthora sojae (strain P6497) TaxID=1094619 RepID=G4YKX7_PHYSP|nr:hypothetical protein PHYSODRAFT_322985 [Phytophthora sojae]EGZ29468.1 hypothetical protein PHYSODRAFT_322985 [Phytophthora sojae]|eukprot:XP_009516743.1 hypothetical protein PHYSODRAFT_322985 [Phytophthora sojae]
MASANLSSAVYGTYHTNMDNHMCMETWGLMTMRLATDVVVLFFITSGLVMKEDIAGFEENITAKNELMC